MTIPRDTLRTMRKAKRKASSALDSLRVVLNLAKMYVNNL
jgi:hypothetical protein